MRSLSIYLGAKRPLPANFPDASLSLSRIGALLLTRAYILTYPRIMDGMDFVLLLGSRREKLAG